MVGFSIESARRPKQVRHARRCGDAEWLLRRSQVETAGKVPVDRRVSDPGIRLALTARRSFWKHRSTAFDFFGVYHCFSVNGHIRWPSFAPHRYRRDVLALFSLQNRTLPPPWRSSWTMPNMAKALTRAILRGKFQASALSIYFRLPPPALSPLTCVVV